MGVEKPAKPDLVFAKTEGDMEAGPPQPDKEEGSAADLGGDDRVPLAAAVAKPLQREVRAVYSERTVRVYQAYNDEIADAAVEHQSFVAPWKPGRMTWVKPSAIWMGYRCGWSQKDKNQARVLAVDLHREAFDLLLSEARLAKSQDEGPCDVVVQWDPERGLGGPKGKDAFTHPMDFRSLQMGIRGEMTKRFAQEFIAQITDVTRIFQEIGRELEHGNIDGAFAKLPREEVYPLPENLAILQIPTPTGAPGTTGAVTASQSPRSKLCGGPEVT